MSLSLMWHRCWPSTSLRNPLSFLMRHRFQPLLFLSNPFSLITWHRCQTFIKLDNPLSLLAFHPCSCGTGIKIFLFLVPLFRYGHVTLNEMARVLKFYLYLYPILFSNMPTLLTRHRCQPLSFVNNPLCFLTCHPCRCGTSFDLIFFLVPFLFANIA